MFITSLLTRVIPRNNNNNNNHHPTWQLSSPYQSGTRTALNRLALKTFPHPPFSPDLPPCGLFPFSKLKTTTTTTIWKVTITKNDNTVESDVSAYWLGQCQYNVTGWDRSHGLPALSRMWQHVKLSDVSLGTRLRYSLVVDEGVKRPNKQIAWCRGHLAEFYVDDIQQLVLRRRLCVGGKGDYIEKWHTILFGVILVRFRLILESCVSLNY